MIKEGNRIPVTPSQMKILKCFERKSMKAIEKNKQILYNYKKAGKRRRVRTG